MRVNGLDKRTFIVTEQEAVEITRDVTSAYKINGNNYYLAKTVLLFADVYEVTFISCDKIETEIEMECE